MMEPEERQKKLAEREKHVRERDLNDINKILEKPEGRRLLYRIIAMAETFHATPTDKRVIGLTLFNDIMITAPDRFLQMQREYTSEEESIRKQYPVEPDELA